MLNSSVCHFIRTFHSTPNNAKLWWRASMPVHSLTLPCLRIGTESSHSALFPRCTVRFTLITKLQACKFFCPWPEPASSPIAPQQRNPCAEARLAWVPYTASRRGRRSLLAAVNSQAWSSLEQLESQLQIVEIRDDPSILLSLSLSLSLFCVCERLLELAKRGLLMLSLWHCMACSLPLLLPTLLTERQIYDRIFAHTPSGATDTLWSCLEFWIRKL